MRTLLDLSIRYKMPLWGSLLILVTAIVISATLLFRAYDDLRRDLLANAANQGRTLASTLAPAIVQDHVWQAYEILSAPVSGASPEHPAQVESLLVLGLDQRVFVSSQPETLPMLAEFRRLAPDFAEVADGIARIGRETEVFEPKNSRHLFVVTPLDDDEVRMGTLVQVYSKEVLLPRFFESAARAAAVGGLVLLVLLPLSWYWGQRTAVPLVRLTERMEELGQRLPEELAPEIYDYNDELGRLFRVYNRTLQQLREKTALEREVLHSERLAAIGRLAAGIAHEINNPLAGMLTTLDTLRRHGAPDERTLRALNVLERGLTQIKETVAALLVEARIKSREFAPQDVEDVHTLVSPQAHKRGIHLHWDNAMGEPVALPSTLLRQVLINLSLNAVQAADDRGAVAVRVGAANGALSIEVDNDGRVLTGAQKAHLFEPFVNAGEAGHGLGLWVCYQIVHQLAGTISVDSEQLDAGGRTRFRVEVPLRTAS